MANRISLIGRKILRKTIGAPINRATRKNLNRANISWKIAEGRASEAQNKMLRAERDFIRARQGDSLESGAKSKSGFDFTRFYADEANSKAAYDASIASARAEEARAERNMISDIRSYSTSTSKLRALTSPAAYRRLQKMKAKRRVK